MRKYLILIFVFISSKLLVAQDWTLTQCIEHAFKNNIQLKQYQLETEFTGINLKKEKHSRLPGLYAGASQQFLFGRSLDRYTNTFVENNSRSTNMSISAEIEIFNGLQTHYAIQKASSDLELSLKNLEKAKNDMALNIASAYLQVLFQIENLKIAEKQAEISRLQLEKSEKLFQAGSIAISSVYEIKAQMAQENLQIIIAQNKVAESTLTLAQMLEIENADSFKISSPEIMIPDQAVLESKEELFASAMNIMPEIKAAELDIKSASTSIKIAKGAYLPRLSASANYYTGYSDFRKLYELNGLTGTYIEKPYPFFNQLSDNANFAIGFNLSIPIFNKNQTRLTVQQTKINTQKKELQSESIKKSLYKDVHQAINNMRASEKKLQASIIAYETQNSAFQFMQQKYDAGASDSYTYTLSKAKLNQTEIDLIQAKYEHVFNLKIIDFYKGKKIEL